MSHPPLLTSSDDVADVVAQLSQEPVYALDTEFHRERTYYPRLALVQLAGAGGVYMVDPLVVDPAELRPLLEGDGVAVIHAARQDLEVLAHAAGAIPTKLFDTQIGAGFLGLVSPSLASLHERELGIQLPKSDRLTDWLARPLSTAQLEYAATDVLHLLELHTRLEQQLSDRGRLDWALDECERLRQTGTTGRPATEAWRKIKDVRQLKGSSLAVAQGLAAWREERAAAIDQPVRFILSDLAIVAVAQRRPESLEQLRRVRGVDERHLRGRTVDQLLDIVAEHRDKRPVFSGDAPPPELVAELRAVVPLVSAWVGQLARDEGLDVALLATRSDLEALLRGDETCRLTEGWRADLLGTRIKALVDGQASLAFDTGGRLILEERSGRALA